MRAIGYSFETALADIIDNSIAAGASIVDIRFSPYDPPYIAVLDDGDGMSASELFEAMRHGSRSPRAARVDRDLGRFGLGLKTASLSQCRRMTVVSIRDGQLSGAEWDLDEVARLQDWALLELDEVDIHAVPHAEELIERGSGTLVVWRNLDRALAGESSPIKGLQDRIDRTREHVALVFHRYLEGPANELGIAINRESVRPIDPFLRTRKGRQALPPEAFQIEGHVVSIEAHILPHVSKLTAQEIALAGGEEGLRRNQGFYVYRNRRLITWGTWFRLAKQEEMTKLARVIVDLPNALDHLWSLDIKKSTAHPPEQVRRGLSQIVDRIADRSRRVYTFRGNKGWQPDVVPAWRRLELRDGRFRYELNRDHDLFNALRQQTPETTGPLLERFVQMIEESFPFESVYSDMASDRRFGTDERPDEIEERLWDTASRLLMALNELPQARSAMLDRLHLLEPFCRHSEITSKIKERLK
jgi:Histidine kinase-, DNA gyrase B-, and HSP90-like ATPase